MAQLTSTNAFKLGRCWSFLSGVTYTVYVTRKNSI